MIEFGRLSILVTSEFHSSVSPRFANSIIKIFHLAAALDISSGVLTKRKQQ
jgi:hypothetical protein